ncbi:ATPase, F1 complex, OSCP/delta subunit [Corchorus capsularis]|uniref:ATPase, F1 complex, OSCP/delta subunit n=1 Tax=Corchorus capsularis TaxID=210143 RepID=A0A1R3H1K1_COCAP|nr:ATPase, F1 complex, OSCP/delta subunit [Corchorus capsularis]
MDTLSSSVSTLKVPNFNSTTRDFFGHLKTPTGHRHLPSLSPRHSFSGAAKTTNLSSNKPANSFTAHPKDLTTNSPFFCFPQASPVNAPYPYAHRKPASGYAAALLDIAQSKSSLDSVQKDVRKLSKLLRNDQIQAFLSDPFVGDKEKGKAIKELARKGELNKHVVILMKMLIERNRLEMVSEVLEEFKRIYEELSETEEVWISSEKKIGEDRLLRIASRVQQLSGAVKVKIRNLVVKDKLPAFVV